MAVSAYLHSLLTCLCCACDMCCACCACCAWLAAALVGGDSMEAQFVELAAFPDVIVATPGGGSNCGKRRSLEIHFFRERSCPEFHAI